MRTAPSILITSLAIGFAATPATSEWAAAAYSAPESELVTSQGFLTKAEAEEAVLRQCAELGGSNCVSLISTRRCIGIALAIEPPIESPRITFVTSGDHSSAAEFAIAFCSGQPGVDRCGLVTTECADLQIEGNE